MSSARLSMVASAPRRRPPRAWPGSSRRDHPGPEGRGDIDGGEADAAARAEHEHPLPLLERVSAGEGEDRRRVALQHGGGDRRVEGRVEGERRSRGDHGALGEPAGPRRHHHPLAEALLGDPLADGEDAPGELGAGDIRQGRRKLVAPGQYHGVDEIDARRLDVDEHLPGAGLGLVDVSDRQVLKWAKGLAEQGAHRASVAGPRPARRCTRCHSGGGRPAGLAGGAAEQGAGGGDVASHLLDEGVDE